MLDSTKIERKSLLIAADGNQSHHFGDWPHISHICSSPVRTHCPDSTPNKPQIINFVSMDSSLVTSGRLATSTTIWRQLRQHLTQFCKLRSPFGIPRSC